MSRPIESPVGLPQRTGTDVLAPECSSAKFKYTIKWRPYATNEVRGLPGSSRSLV
jgi:hypothetical protein